jgi:hypothetical protein
LITETVEITLGAFPEKGDITIKVLCEKTKEWNNGIRKILK